MRKFDANVGTDATGVWLCAISGIGKGKAPKKTMNFDLTDEQKLFAESVRRFAQDHLAAGALKRAHDQRFPYDVASSWPSRGQWVSRRRGSEGGQGGTLVAALACLHTKQAISAKVFATG